MNYLYLILNWIFGVFFLLAGLFFLIFSPLGGICLIATATLLLPAIRNFFYSKTQKAVPAKVRVASICVLIIAFGVFSNQSLNKKMQEVAEQQLQDKAKQEGKLIQDNIAYFNNNREQIILSIRTLYAAKEYQSVVSESNKYLVSSDKELEQLNRQAKEEILIIQKAERAAKAHAERILKINELLEKIKTIPQTEFIQHQEIYQQLLKFEPENQEYKEKLAYFSQKQSEYEKLKEEERLQKEKNIRFNLYIKMVDNAENRFKKNKESLKKYYSTEINAH